MPYIFIKYNLKSPFYSVFISFPMELAVLLTNLRIFIYGMSFKHSKSRKCCMRFCIDSCPFPSAIKKYIRRTIVMPFIQIKSNLKSPSYSDEFLRIFSVKRLLSILKLKNIACGEIGVCGTVVQIPAFSCPKKAPKEMVSRTTYSIGHTSDSIVSHNDNHQKPRDCVTCKVRVFFVIYKYKVSLIFFSC